MAKGRSYKKLIPVFVGSIINYFSNDTEIQLNKQLQDAVDLSQLRTMALETADPIHWPLPQTSANCTVQVPPQKCDCSL